MSQYHEYIAALNTSSPTLFLDLDNFHKNLYWAEQECGDKKIRLATKSLRSVEIIRRILKSHGCFQGLMTYTLPESLWLKSQGFNDILMGYPTTDLDALKTLAKDPEGITLMVDRVEHLSLLESIASSHKINFSICVDIDLSMDLPGVRFGVYRSSIHQEKQLRHFLEYLKSCPSLKLVGMMGYEAQIAGVMDESSPLIKSLKKLSLTQLKKRRAEMFRVIESYGHKLQIVNGGGTGSLKHTAHENCVTEITIGSAFYAPVLFDHYEDFKLSPALFFALPVVRMPTPDIVTILGGGYLASGEISPIKQPQVYLPQGLSYLKHEGFGEVQTPLKLSRQEKLSLGDLVILRHAKAGEICERFNQISLIEGGIQIGQCLTYRGEGKSFL